MVVRCKRCNRVLRHPLYKAIGYGAVCASAAGIVIPGAVISKVRKLQHDQRFRKTGGDVRVDKQSGQQSMFSDCSEKEEPHETIHD